MYNHKMNMKHILNNYLKVLMKKVNLHNHRFRKGKKKGKESKETEMTANKTKKNDKPKL